jgi:hypothetical protein
MTMNSRVRIPLEIATHRRGNGEKKVEKRKRKMTGNWIRKAKEDWGRRLLDQGRSSD